MLPKEYVFELRKLQRCRSAVSMMQCSQRAGIAAAVCAVLLFAAAILFGDKLRLSEQANSAFGFKTRKAPAAQPDPNGPTLMYVIESEEDAKAMAKLHATRKKELLFTTYTFTHKGSYSYGAVNMAMHMWENLREIDLIKHTILLTYDLHSCQVLWEHGIPCFLDRWMPQPGELPGQYGSDVPHWYQKYAWALKFLEFGYTTVFMELDMIFFENPLPYYNPKIDLEGLSDWRRADLGTPKERFTGPCSVYNFLEWGGNRPEDPSSQYHINPCMSTGFWFIQPRQTTVDFLAGFIDLELNWRNWQTDQRLWNEVIMAYLIGHGKQNPMTLSLLNNTQFCNFEVDELRREQGIPRKPVMLHGGGMSGGEKEPYMRSHGYWKSEQWQDTSAVQHIKFLSQYFERKLPTFGLAHLG